MNALVIALIFQWQCFGENYSTPQNPVKLAWRCNPKMRAGLTEIAVDRFSLHR